MPIVNNIVNPSANGCAAWPMHQDLPDLSDLALDSVERPVPLAVRQN
jgi:hypothetical protein